MTSLVPMALIRLRRQHHSLHPSYLLHLPRPADLASPESQGYLVDHILHDLVIQDVQPERGYRIAFWKRVVSELEEGVRTLQAEDQEHIDDYEVDERIYEALAELMISNPSDGPSDMPRHSYRTFLYDRPPWMSGRGEGRVTLLEEQVAIQAGTTGLRTWTSSLHLAHHVLHHPEILSFPSTRSSSALAPMIELGAGTGFFSILLSQLGVDVVATDLGDNDNEQLRQAPLNRLNGNVALNELENPPMVMPLNWTDALRPPAARPPVWQEIASGPSRTIVAADVIYDPDLIPAVVATIVVLLRGFQSSLSLIAATVRNEATLEHFVTTCTEHGLFVKTLDLTPMNADQPTFWDSALDRCSEVRIMRIVLSENG